MVSGSFPGSTATRGPSARGAHWQFAFHPDEIVYIWCVTFGVIPLAAVLIAAARRDFWTRRTAWLAGGAVVSLLFAFGSSLPFYRVLYSVPGLRRLRYPIKFYLLTTLCLALLAGVAAQRLRPEASRAGRRAGVILLVFALLFGTAFFVSRDAAAFDRAVAPYLSGLAKPASELLPEIRRVLSGDALFGLLAVAGSRSRALSGARSAAQVTCSGRDAAAAFPWALPSFRVRR
jgi:hypothetical protein